MFRDGERRVIARLLEQPPHILATGGGAFMDPATRALIARRGVSVWLRADLDVLVARVSRRNNRPLLQRSDPRSVLAELIERRHPVYAEADIVIDSSDGSAEQTTTRVIAALANCLLRVAAPRGGERAMTDGDQAATERLRVALAERSYDILVGPGLIETAGAAMLPLLRRRQAVIVTDEQVARHHLPALRRSLDEHGIANHAIVLPPGEGTKDLAHFGRLVDDVLACGIERGTMLVALGGGVVGDIAGFAAATLLRGIDFVQIPTTLLAQVDSSVGGKTAINTPAGKNLVGAFYQPRLVLADTASSGDAAAPRGARRLWRGRQIWADPRRRFLRVARTRRPRGLRSRTGGADPCGHDQLPHEGRDRRSRRARDRRRAGAAQFRPHFGHALEAETGFGDRLLHGEAVALGMVLAFDFAVRLGLASGQEAHRVRRHLAASGLPTTLAEIGLSGDAADRLLAHMGKDKKVRDGAITLILPRRIGDCFVMRDASRDRLREFLSEAA